MNNCKIKILILLIIALSSVAQSNQPQTMYPKLKSAFIIQFANNITWNNESGIRSFRIGLLGDDIETFKAIELATKNKTIGNKPVEILAIKKVSQITDLQLLYVSKSEVENIDRIYHEIETKNILLITEECTESQFIMLNILYNQVSQSVSFEINKANLIIENFTINPELLLLGGSEVDIRNIYQEMRQRLTDENKNVIEQREIINKQAIKITEQNDSTDKLIKSIENLEKRIDLKEANLSKLNNTIKDQNFILIYKSKEIANRDAEFQKQKTKVIEWENKIRLKSKEFDNLLTEIGKQKNMINEQKNVLDVKENYINTQKKYIYAVIGFAITLLLLGLSVFSAYYTKKRANIKLEERVVQRTKELEDEIRDRKQIEVELLFSKEKAEESEKSYKDVVETTSDLITVVNNQGVLLFVNHASTYFYGIPSAECIGKHALEFIYPDDRDLTRNEFAKWLKSTECNFSFENRQISVDGKILQVAWNIHIQRNKNEVVNITSIARDVTKQKEIEYELIKAKEKAEESDRLKTAFLQNMSHEIRTPMNAIMGFSDLLYRNADNKTKLKKYSDIINQRCADLLTIINDILDIAKIESGQLSVNIEECNLPILFDELNLFFTEYQKRIGKENINLQFHATCSSDDSIILTDNVKLKQIFINLISNAFKFTETGSIEAGCKYDTNNNLIFYVSDTGVGIPVDKQEIIFERFAQLNPGINKLVSGTGLGLSIVKGLVRLLGGEITLESKEGVGSIFTFSFLYTIKNTIQNKPIFIEPREYNFTNKTILIVEDDYYNAEYLKEILLIYGFNILTTDNGQSAIDLSLNKQIDLVLMDIGLPDINGYEVTRLIRIQKPNLKIIAQTAYASFDEKQKALDAGCNDYISKPTKQELLLNMMSNHLSA
jgi:PAS domain S-box-containing protein